MTPIEEVKAICESVIEQWRNNTLSDRATNIAVFADTILTILNRQSNEDDTV